ncbi:MAG: YicC family protein [Planctomycetota bacterium]|nr:YicC family protein [Planctomycetota bacterium]
MLLSMTGFGDARRQDGSRTITAEVRTVNNRFLKCSIRLPDAYSAFESDIEKLVRSSISRGTVNVTIRIERASEANRYRIDTDVLAAYAAQIDGVSDKLGLASSGLDALLQLPGVVSERSGTIEDASGDWHLLESAVGDALKKLDTFRRAEGAAMADDLRANLAIIETELEGVVVQAPGVVSEFRDRLKERVAELLSGSEAKVNDADLIREVSIFAERTDINEEIARLRSHIVQFKAFLEDHVSQGRKLDFLTQELFREVNTIGSKANNVAIAHRGVEMKAAVEKIREILQNIE